MCVMASNKNVYMHQESADNGEFQSDTPEHVMTSANNEIIQRFLDN